MPTETTPPGLEQHPLVYFCRLAAPLGTMLAAAEDNALIGLWFTGQNHFPAAVLTWIEDPAHPVLVALKSWLKAYFAGQNVEPEFGLNPGGTTFQKTVWKALLRIPNGQVTTYGRIADEIALARGLPAFSARAVGQAIGRNPISILIPCHRVVGVNGRLTGYAGGLDRKRALLQLENSPGRQNAVQPAITFL